MLMLTALSDDTGTFVCPMLSMGGITKYYIMRNAGYEYVQVFDTETGSYTVAEVDQFEDYENWGEVENIMDSEEDSSEWNLFAEFPNSVAVDGIPVKNLNDYLYNSMYIEGVNMSVKSKFVQFKAVVEEPCVVMSYGSAYVSCYFRINEKATGVCMTYEVNIEGEDDDGEEYAKTIRITFLFAYEDCKCVGYTYFTAGGDVDVHVKANDLLNNGYIAKLNVSGLEMIYVDEL